MNYTIIKPISIECCSQAVGKNKNRTKISKFVQVCLKHWGISGNPRNSAKLSNIWGQGKVWFQNSGIFGDSPQYYPKIGEGEKGTSFKGFGDSLGTGTVKILGNIWDKFPKNC